MSAYKLIQTEFRNIDSLKKALKDVGFGVFDLSAGPKANRLELMPYNYRPGQQIDKVVLRLPKSHYDGYEDTGFAWDEATKSYRAIISTHDGGGNFGPSTLKQVQQRYAYHEIKRQAAVKGYTVREVKGTDGVIRLQLAHR
jgi:hypothetical protein